MRIGVSAILSGAGGGIYQHTLSILDAVARLNTGDEWVIFAAGDHPLLERYSDRWEVRPFEPELGGTVPVRTIASRILGEGRVKKTWRRLKPLVARSSGSMSRAGRWLSRQGMDLMLYPAPTPLAYQDSVPFLMAIHDLQHRLQPEFPEVSATGEYEVREGLFRAAAKNALFLIADSETGRQDILNLYGSHGATADRVKVLPFCPPFYLWDRSQEENDRGWSGATLPERFLFYPAAFWPHKNHAAVIRALAVIRDREQIEVPLVLCGSSSGALRSSTRAEVFQSARELQVERQITYLDYVADDQMRFLYERAAALVMPTFFGPTNIPVYEAWMLGCPVITSDIRGIREQVEDAGLLVDPTSPAALADAMVKVWVDTALAESLSTKGTKRVEGFGPDRFRQRLGTILEEAKDQVLA